jgi:WD40 repeat protein/tRNA A-37 threonylcarbamoyl transferase component Bud32
MALTKGQMLGDRYRIAKLLGQGGMGAVYRAWDTRLNAPVALKEMIPQPGLDAETLTHLREQFRQEAEVLARLSHPNLVGVTDFFEEAGNAYLVMRFVEGESLASLVEREGALPEARVLTWARQLLDALTYCHGRSIIHRDVKPHNVIITPDGHAVLVDFGLVKLWDSRDPHTKSVMRGMGTPEYAPPEQYAVRVQHTDSRSDLYSLGATLYHALTGQFPASANDRIASPESFLAPRQIVPGISEQFEAVILRAMSLSLEERFSSAVEMREALENTAPSLPAPLLHSAARARASTKVMWTKRAAKRALGWTIKGAIAVVLTIVAIVVVAKPWESAVRPTVGPTSGPPATLTPTPMPTPTPAPALAGTPVWQPVAAISPDNAGRVTELARWGKGAIEEITWSPDGSWLAVASMLGVHLYDARTLVEVRVMEPDARVEAVAFPPDGKTLLASGSEGGLRLWRTSDGELLRSWDDAGYVLGAAFSPQGRLAASASGDGRVRVWDVSSGVPLHILEGHTDWVWSVAFSPDGDVLASASEDGTVRLWDVSSGSSLRVIDEPSGAVRCVAFSPDGETLASLSGDGTLRLWRAGDGTLVYALEGGAGNSGVAFSPDGTMLVSGSDVVRMWQVSDGTLLRTLAGHTASIRSIAFAPSGAVLASSADDGTVRLWRVADGAPQRILEYTAPVWSVAFSPDGKTFASGSNDGTVRLWQVTDGTIVRVLEGHTGVIFGVAFSPDGRILASASGDSSVRLWQVSNGAFLRALLGHEGAVHGVAFSPDGEMLASTSDDGTLRVWQVDDGSAVIVLPAYETALLGVAFSPDGAFLASGTADGKVQLWRHSDWTLARTLEKHTGPVWAVAFSPDGEMLASASEDGTVRLWQVSAEMRSRELWGHRWPAYSVAFSPDGTLLASGSGEDRMRLWQVSDGACLGLYFQPMVRSVAFSVDGKLVASGGDDGSVRLWGVLEE